MRSRKISGRTKSLMTVGKNTMIQKPRLMINLKRQNKKIADAQEEIDAIARVRVYVFDRSDNPGYSTFAQNVERLGAVASVFPMFFLLVAVLVCVTTMSGLVEEKRKEIGILKALGYNKL